jgi:hypothetical protein
VEWAYSANPGGQLWLKLNLQQESTTGWTFPWPFQAKAKYQKKRSSVKPFLDRQGSGPPKAIVKTVLAELKEVTSFRIWIEGDKVR